MATAQLRVGHGDPASEIQAVDLIVLTWKGEWRDHTAIFKAVVDAAPCPIMVVRI